MILTCPACGTQYVVKDGAIPPDGRRVRCAACQHSWHQEPEGTSDVASPADEAPAAAQREPRPFDAPADEERRVDDETMSRDEAALAAQGPASFAPPGAVAPPVDPYVEPPVTAPAPSDDQTVDRIEGGGEAGGEWQEDSEFSPFAARDERRDQGRRGGRVIAFAIALIAIAAIALALWFLAPAEWRERLGVATAAETPLQLMVTHRDRQRLASGNELLAVSGRVINPTSEQQSVPPIRASLRNAEGRVIYSWTIAPPARELPPGGSASFNSAEMDVPAEAVDLTVSLETAPPA